MWMFTGGRGLKKRQLGNIKLNTRQFSSSQYLNGCPLVTLSILIQPGEAGRKTRELSSFTSLFFYLLIHLFSYFFAKYVPSPADRAVNKTDMELTI